MSKAFLIMLLFDSIWLAAFMFMPIIRREDAFFGVRVSAEFYRGEGRRILHRFWFWLCMTFTEVEVIGLLIAIYRPQMQLAQVTARIVVFPALAVLYVHFYHQVKAYELIEEEQRFSSALKTRHLSDYTNAALEIAVALLTILPTLTLVYFYPRLPERVPTHWGLNGEPDHWSTKTFGSVFFLPIMLIYLQGVFLLVKYSLLGVKMTLPSERAAEYLHYKEQTLRLNMQLLDTMRAVLTIMFGSFILEFVCGALPEFRHLKWLFTWMGVGTLAMIFIILIYVTYRFVMIDRRLKAEVGRVYVQRPHDAAHWYGGGLFYFNPDDPALCVEKLVGFGYTINLGNKWAYIGLAYMLITPLLLALLISD